MKKKDPTLKDDSPVTDKRLDLIIENPIAAGLSGLLLAREMKRERALLKAAKGVVAAADWYITLGTDAKKRDLVLALEEYRKAETVHAEGNRRGR
jgi:hypothetical protein